jgi:hypothetical protein
MTPVTKLDREPLSWIQQEPEERNETTEEISGLSQ